MDCTWTTAIVAEELERNSPSEDELSTNPELELDSELELETAIELELDSATELELAKELSSGHAVIEMPSRVAKQTIPSLSSRILYKFTPNEFPSQAVNEKAVTFCEPGNGSSIKLAFAAE